MCNHSYGNLFPLQVHFHANKTHFPPKGFLHEDSFWNWGTRLKTVLIQLHSCFLNLFPYSSFMCFVVVVVIVVVVVVFSWNTNLLLKILWYSFLFRIMMLTVMKNTKNPVKFWFLKNYLSPTIKVWLSFTELTAKIDMRIVISLKKVHSKSYMVITLQAINSPILSSLVTHGTSSKEQWVRIKAFFLSRHSPRLLLKSLLQALGSWSCYICQR